MKTETDEQWTSIILPKVGWFDVDFKELWRYKDLILLFVRRDFVAIYKQTILGPAWFIIQPLLTTIMFTIVFGNIAKISTDGLPKMLFYLSRVFLELSGPEHCHHDCHSHHRADIVRQGRKNVYGHRLI